MTGSPIPLGHGHLDLMSLQSSDVSFKIAYPAGASLASFLAESTLTVLTATQKPSRPVATNCEGDNHWMISAVWSGMIDGNPAQSGSNFFLLKWALKSAFLARRTEPEFSGLPGSGVGEQPLPISTKVMDRCETT